MTQQRVSRGSIFGEPCDADAGTNSHRAGSDRSRLREILEQLACRPFGSVHIRRWQDDGKLVAAQARHGVNLA